MCILDCLLVLAIIFYMYKAKIWMGVVTSLQSHHEETRQLSGERDNVRNNARCTQARKTTHHSCSQYSVIQVPVQVPVLKDWETFDLYQYQYPCLKYKYKYPYFGSKYQYQYQYHLTSTCSQYHAAASYRLVQNLKSTTKHNIMYSRIYNNALQLTIDQIESDNHHTQINNLFSIFRQTV